MHALCFVCAPRLDCGVMRLYAMNEVPEVLRAFCSGWFQNNVCLSACAELDWTSITLSTLDKKASAQNYFDFRNHEKFRLLQRFYGHLECARFVSEKIASQIAGMLHISCTK
jgi:hypothetical protein